MGRESITESVKRLKRRKMWKRIGLVLAVLETAAAVSFGYLVFQLNMVPFKYELIGVIVLLLITVYIYASQFTRMHWIGKVLAVLLCVTLVYGDVFVLRVNGTTQDVSGVKTKVDEIAVYVLKDDAAQTINDASGYHFGYSEKLDTDRVDQTFGKLESAMGIALNRTGYQSLDDLVASLYNQETEAIVLNSSYITNLEDTYPTFAEDTRVIYTDQYTTEIKNVSNKNLTQDPFVIYLSGNDDWGELTKTGRSDVNILIEVNPKTHQILLLNTPRDYYVMVNSLTNGIGKDKLTHAGEFGVDASMATLSSLYGDLAIDYYVKVNFTGVEGIVDALGGITVDSPVAFTTSPDTSSVTYTFQVGENEMDGDKALAFCRERQAFGAGDNQRGKDQMAVVAGIIKKLQSPAILTNYAQILKSASGMFATSLEDNDISSLVKLMLDNPSEWKVQNYAVTGTGILGPSYFFNYSAIYMMEPDMNDVNMAIDLLNKIKNGDVFDVSAYSGRS